MATAASTTSPSSTVPSRPTYSCIRCADRKVKCDRERPCGACVKHNADCVFQPAPPPRKRHKRVKDQILSDRLRQYEALLQEQGIDPSNLPHSPGSEAQRRSAQGEGTISKNIQLQTPSSIESEPSPNVNQTKVVHVQGRSQFIENPLWRRVAEELHDPEEALKEFSNEASDAEASDDDFDLVLGSPANSTARSRHPAPERILQLWQIFVDNVDPLTKVVHVPTLRPAIHKASNNTSTIPRSFEALMFAIYSAAVMSVKDAECLQILGESRNTLLMRYILATKAALSRARFMGTNSLVVLQALVLHILSVRDIYEPRVIWSLTGVAVRIAQCMGLERDGTALGLPLFETEMRRRLWWLLKTHDFRTAELCGLAKFRDIDTGPDATKWPINTNDDQLHPDMTAPPADSNTLTDTVFISLRYELANFAAGRIAKFRQQGKDASQFNLDSVGVDRIEIKEELKEMEDTLETKYLRYCDPSQPLHLLTMLLARSSMNIVHFLTNHPRRWVSIEETPLAEREWIWELALKNLERHHMIQTNPQLKQFAWHGAYFLHFHSFIHILDTLQANPLMADAERAWHLVGGTYDNHPGMAYDMKEPIYVAVGNLCLKAYNAREAALQKANMSPPPTPEFISVLRRQREEARAKNQARAAKSGQARNAVAQDQTNSLNIAPSETFQSTLPQQDATLAPANFGQAGTAGGEDPFWFINRFDDNEFGNSNDVMNLDPNFMMAQDQAVEGNAPQAAIDWEQWDSWLAESNVMRPLASVRDFRAGA